MRGVPDGTVSTPITWDEVASVQPRELTMATVPARFAAQGDPHAGIDDTAYRLDTLGVCRPRPFLPTPPLRPQ